MRARAKGKGGIMLMFPLLLLAAPRCRGGNTLPALHCAQDYPPPFGTVDKPRVLDNFFVNIEFETSVEKGETSVEKGGNEVGHAANQTAPLDIGPGDEVTLTLKIKNNDSPTFWARFFDYVIMALEVAPMPGQDRVEIENDKFEILLPDLPPLRPWYTFKCEDGRATLRKSAIYFHRRFNVTPGSEATFSLLWTAPPSMGTTGNSSQYVDLGFSSTIGAATSRPILQQGCCRCDLDPTSFSSRLSRPSYSLDKRVVGPTLRYWPTGVIQHLS